VSLLIGSFAIAALAAASPADAAAPTAGWTVHAIAEPSVFSAKDALPCETEQKCDRYQLLVENVGGKASEGVVTLTDVLPAGITTLQKPRVGFGPLEEQWECTNGAGHSTVVCELNESVQAGHYAPYLNIIVSAPSSETPRVLSNEVTVEDEGTETARNVLETQANGPASSFAVNEFSLEPGGETAAPSGGQ